MEQVAPVTGISHILTSQEMKKRDSLDFTLKIRVFGGE
jgi:hypothetical protein